MADGGVVEVAEHRALVSFLHRLVMVRASGGWSAAMAQPIAPSSVSSLSGCQASSWSAKVAYAALGGVIASARSKLW